MNMLEMFKVWIVLTKISAHHIALFSGTDMEFSTNFT